MNVSTVQVGQATTLTLTTYSDGTQSDLGTFTVGIDDADGTEVVAAGTPVTDNSDGTYTYTLAKQTQPKFLTVTWTESGGTVLTTYVDVVGSLLFDENMLRTFDKQNVSDTTNYTDAAIAEAHYQAAEYIEEQTGRSYIRRYARAVFTGNASYTADLAYATFQTASGLALPRPGALKDIATILSADDGSTVATANVQIDGPLLVRTDQGWTAPSSPNVNNCTVEYEYGVPYPTGIASRVGMLLAQQWLVASRIPANATSYSDSLGSYAFDPTRLPYEAWQWLQQKPTVFF